MCELIQRVERFMKSYNETGRPFSWTATATSILAKLGRLTKAISGASHQPGTHPSPRITSVTGELRN